MLVKKISPHLKQLAKSNQAISRQFFEPDKSARRFACPTFTDPLEEDQYEVTKGLIHKYQSRVLALLTMTCASYCRFCTRQRRVSDIMKGIIRYRDIDRMVEYVKTRPDIREVIFSGGDPMMVPKNLIYSLKAFSQLKNVKLMRIGTRMPVSDPKHTPVKELIRVVKQIKKPVYVLIHFEHPSEITPETIKVINALNKAGCSLLSQSVFLKGVNDNYNTLYELFNRLLEIGVAPYYLYRCDPVKGAERYICDFNKEIAIMTKLWKNLSGLACPTYVIDAPEGSGKIPVPLDFWQFNRNRYKDFIGRNHKVI